MQLLIAFKWKFNAKCTYLSLEENYTFFIKATMNTIHNLNIILIFSQICILLYFFKVDRCKSMKLTFLRFFLESQRPEKISFKLVFFRYLIIALVVHDKSTNLHKLNYLFPPIVINVFMSQKSRVGWKSWNITEI